MKDEIRKSKEELIEEIAALEAEAIKHQTMAEKWKRDTDKNSKLAARLKRQLNERREREAVEHTQEESSGINDEEFEATKNKVRTVEATKRYMALEMDEKLAEETAKAEVAGDMETVNENLKKHISEIKKRRLDELKGLM